MENLLNLLFPPKCLFCKKEKGIICASCLAKAKPLLRDFTVFSNFAIYCLFDYSSVVQKCIKLSKYPPYSFSALRVLSAYGVSLMPKDKYSKLIVVPIPMSKKKMKIRGFNHAKVISSEVAHRYGLACGNSILIRKKETTPQYKLSKALRISNVENAFKAVKPVFGMKILLVDDICTAGSTMYFARKTLLEAGALEVLGFCLSRKL